MLGVCDNAQTDVVFLLDSSSVVKEPDFVRMLQFCKDILNGADIDSGNVRVGFVLYGSKAVVQFELDDYNSKNEIFDAIDEVPKLRGKRNMADAIKAAIAMLTKDSNRGTVDSTIILMTAGISNVRSKRTLREADRAKAEGITIIGVGIRLPHTDELDAIISEPALETKYVVDRFEDLHYLTENLVLPQCEGKLWL